MAKNNLNISLGVDVSNLKKGFDEAIKITQQAAGKTEAEMKEMADAIVRQLGKIGSQSTMRGAIRQMENLAGTMSRFGMEGTAAFNEVIKQTGKLKAEQQDLKDLIDASRPDAPFKALGNALQGAAQGFAGIQGAMALFGAESEETQKMLMKIQAALALVEGTKAIDQLSDSFAQLNLVIRANPLIAGATVAAAIIAVLVSLSNETKKLSREEQIYNDIKQAGLQNAEKEYANLYKLVAIAKDESIAKQKRADAISEINKLMPGYLDNINTETINTEKGTAAINRMTEALLKQAMVKGAEEGLQKIGKEIFKLQNTMRDFAEKNKAFFENGLIGVSLMAGAPEEMKAFNLEKNRLNALYKSLMDETKVYTKFIAENPISITQPTGGVTTGAIKERKPIDFDMRMQGIGTTNLINPNALKRQQEIQMPEPRSIPVERVAELDAELAKVQITTEEVNASFQNLAMSGLTDIATAMGTAIATGQNLGQAIGQGLLRAMAGFMKQLGEMFIKAGLAKLAFDSAMISIGGAPLAIAAGTALVAASAAMTAKLQQANQPAKFAEGGLVPAGFSGDSFPALMSSGEAAIPLHNPRAMAKLRDGLQINSGIRIYGKFDGRDIYLANEKYSKDRRR